MYKKLLFMVVVFFTTFTLHSADAASPAYKTVQTSHIKESKKKGAETVLTVKANTRVKLLSKTRSWAYVQAGKTKGYLSLRSVMPLETPLSKNSMNVVMTYKGTDIVSINRTSYKIDPALRPFFKQNADVLRSTLVVPRTKDRTLVGFKKLHVGFFTKVSKPFIIDKAAASRIDSLYMPRTDVTVTTEGQLRQVVVDTYENYSPPKDDVRTVTLNGPIKQLHTLGVVKLAGTGTINRWDIAKTSKYSFEVPVYYTGEIGFLNIRNIDAVVRGSSNLKVRTVSAPTKTHVLHGKNGVIGAIKPSKTIRGKKMSTKERAVDSMMTNLNESSVRHTLDSLGIPYSKAHVADYVTALQQNELAGPNKRLVNSFSDVKDIIRLVDTAMTAQPKSHPYVSVSDKISIQTENPPKYVHNEYKRAVTAVVRDGRLAHILFKRPDTAKLEWLAREKDGRHFINTYAEISAPGDYQAVLIEDGRVSGFTYKVVNAGQSSIVPELVRINNEPISTYQQAAPAFDAKIVKEGYRSYIVVRSQDKQWLKNVHSYRLIVNPNFISGGHATNDQVDLGGWNPSDCAVLYLQDRAKLSNGLTIQSFGYKDAEFN